MPSPPPLHPVDPVPLVCFRAHSFWLLHIFTETQRLLPVARRWLNAVYSKRKCGPNQNNMPVMTHADDFLPSKWNNMAKITCFRYWFIRLYQSFELYKKKEEDILVRRGFGSLSILDFCPAFAKFFPWWKLSEAPRMLTIFWFMWFSCEWRYFWVVFILKPVYRALHSGQF